MEGSLSKYREEGVNPDSTNSEGNVARPNHEKGKEEGMEVASPDSGNVACLEYGGR